MLRDNDPFVTKFSRRHPKNTVVNCADIDGATPKNHDKVGKGLVGSINGALLAQGFLHRHSSITVLMALPCIMMDTAGSTYCKPQWARETVQLQQKQEQITAELANEQANSVCRRIPRRSPQHYLSLQLPQSSLKLCPLMRYVHPCCLHSHRHGVGPNV